MEIYIKDDPILNWPGDTDNKKKIDLKVIEQMEVFGDWKWKTVGWGGFRELRVLFRKMGGQWCSAGFGMQERKREKM